MLTKKNLVKLAVVLIAGTALLNTVCFAAEPAPGAEQPKMVKVQGMVNVTMDVNEITKVTLVTKDKVVYDVKLDVKGMELGKTMADKEVEVEGLVSKKGVHEWIKVQSYKAVEKTPAAKTK
ncbi:MAG: hypothetical protein PHQ35_04590 [Phycisphaerae bacterium]|nr:hypothetical protein [Phycisphaerae bacterium]MDD5380205.1 hypothetical protein [Phycisphaerae bacterium]